MPASDLRSDVLIVGAGPTGLLLANLLGQMGVRTIVIERNADTVQEPRAVSIDDESMRALQAAGLADEIAAITARGYGSLYRGPNGKIFAQVKPNVKEYGFEKRNAFEQPAFEKRLRSALNRFANVTCHFQAEMVGVAQNDDEVVASVQSANGSFNIAARYMVACDGARSTARKILEIALVGSTFKEPWLIVDLHSTKNTCFHTEVFCNPKRSAISLPGPDGIRRYEFKLNPGETTEMAETEQFARKLMGEIGPDIDAPIKRLRVYTFHARTAESWRKGRIFLAGDAAHLTPPFAGQGMNSGLRDAHNLAWKLDEALRSQHPEALLKSYEIERKPHAQAMIDLALIMGRVMIPASPLVGVLIRTGFTLLGLFGPAKNYFLQMKYKPKPRFKDGLLKADGFAQKASVIGRMIPQPRVTTSTRHDALLDDLLPDRPVFMIFDQDPCAKISQETTRKILQAGAHILGLTPEGTNPLAGHFDVVRDTSGFFSQAPFLGYLGQALLLRRDRYVAASVPAEQIEDLLPFLRQLRSAHNELAAEPSQFAARKAS